MGSLVNRANAGNAPSDAARSYDGIIHNVAFWVTRSMLVLVPLAFSTFVYRAFSLPKFLILLAGSASLVPLIGFIGLRARRENEARRNRADSRHMLLVTVYVCAIAISTIFGAAPVVSFFGSFENQMGLITRLCFYICFLAIIFGIGHSRRRLLQTLWALSLTGLCVATYAFAQFFGRDLFLPASLYSFNSSGRSVVRAIGTLGHADYLGNFLLYTTPLGVGLAVASRGRTRRFGIIAAVVSTAAIVFSGTRGAWFGAVIGAIVFAGLELGGKSRESNAVRFRPIVLRVAIGCAITLLLALLIASNPASSSIVTRTRLLVTEGFTGSGRTLLWRDSLRMVPACIVTGCGPEGFRKAFLAYKSNELARLAPDINNESSHSSYLDAAVSFGLLGAILYAAIIVSAFWLLSRARARAADQRERVIITGLLSSLAAVSVHNAFIFDQIPTGLYFFCFLGLAVVVGGVAGETRRPDAHNEQQPSPKPPGAIKSRQAVTATGNNAALGIIASSGALLLVSSWYSWCALDADNQIKKAFIAASIGNLDQVIDSADHATRIFDPSHQYDFAAARALTLSAEKLRARRESSRSRIEDDELAHSTEIAIDAAMRHANRSLAHTLTPDSNYLLLGYLAFLSGDVPKLHAYSTQAVTWDPRFTKSRWLMAEAYLAEGDNEQAAREAEIALDISPSLSQAKAVLARALGESEPDHRTLEDSIRRARSLVDAGEPARAEHVLRRAIGRSPVPCSECHRLLALIYEAAESYESAIAEWQSVLIQSPDSQSAEGAASRIEALKQKTGTGK